MSSRCFLLIYSVLAVAGMAGCSKANGPQQGIYRASVALQGGEVPMQLRIDRQDSTTQLWVIERDAVAQATDLHVDGNELQAVLPHDLGQLKVRFDRNSLNGELRVTAGNGEQAFPVHAKRDEQYRFFKDSLSDNADVSGTWRLELGASSQPVALTQTYDSVDGHIKLQDTPCDIAGQMHNDDTYLAVFCRSAFWLLKGSVNGQGELEGDAWRNNDAPIRWHAKRSDEPVIDQDDPSRHVSLPWAVPTR